MSDLLAVVVATVVVPAAVPGSVSVERALPLSSWRSWTQEEEPV